MFPSCPTYQLWHLSSAKENAHCESPESFSRTGTISFREVSGIDLGEQWISQILPALIWRGLLSEIVQRRVLHRGVSQKWVRASSATVRSGHVLRVSIFEYRKKAFRYISKPEGYVSDTYPCYVWKRFPSGNPLHGIPLTIIPVLGSPDRVFREVMKLTCWMAMIQVLVNLFPY